MIQKLNTIVILVLVLSNPKRLGLGLGVTDGMEVRDGEVLRVVRDTSLFLTLTDCLYRNSNFFVMFFNFVVLLSAVCSLT